MPKVEKKYILAIFQVLIAEEWRIDVVGIPVGPKRYQATRAAGVIRDRIVDRLGSLIARMPDTLSATLVATDTLDNKAGYLERGVDTNISNKANRRADDRALPAYDDILELWGVADESTLSDDRRPTPSLTLQLYPLSDDRRPTPSLTFQRYQQEQIRF